MKATLVLLVAALVLVAAGCGGGGGGESEEDEGGTTSIAGVAANDHGTADATGKDELEVELDDNYFEPTVIKGTPGSQLKLELENEGGSEHNFSLSDQNIDQDVEPGEKADVTVTVPQSGEVSFVCKYHEQLGMAGALAAG
jgi:plastocyanin